MIRIKVLCALFKPSQPPTRCAGTHEFVYDPACEDYDWLVVFDEMPVEREVLRCPRERTILCTWEPVSIKSYSRTYTRQFGHLLTNRPPEAERHPHYHLGRGYFPMFVKSVPASSEAILAGKKAVVSAVCSAKRMRHTKHEARFELMRRLAADIPGFDWYGRGIRPLVAKEEALLPYRYHVAVENHIAPGHWTEKLSDSILCECLTFYAGDPDVGKVLPPESLIPIPIDDPETATRIIRSAIGRDEYEHRRPAILEAKRLIVTRYNFWAQVIELVKSEAGATFAAEPAGRIYSRRALRRHSAAAAAEDLWIHLKRGFR